MKLRIQGNSLRLRLKQGEISTLGSAGKVEDRITFGPDAALVYSIEAADVPSVAVDFRDGIFRVSVPRAEVTAWTETDRVGLETEFHHPDGTTLLLLEKDFQCLHRRPEEDESDNFPHPKA